MIGNDRGCESEGGARSVRPPSRRPPAASPGSSSAPRCSATPGCRAAARRSGSSARTCRSVRSYKVRGAYNVLAQLDAGARARGVVCASAGNHGQGLAYACASLGIEGRVFLPTNTPRQKRERITAIGGDHVQVVVTGATYDEAAVAAAADALRTGATVVPAFDDLRTIAGQGTVALEVVDQLVEQTGAPPDVLVVPVGGGGLLAGCVAWLGRAPPGRPGRRRRAAGRGVRGRGPCRRRTRWTSPTSTRSSTGRRSGGPASSPRPPSPRSGRRAGPGARGRGLRRAAGHVRLGRHRRGTGRRPGLERARRRRPRRAGPARRLRPVRGQQRRQPLRRDRRAGRRVRGPQALLPGRVPAAARGAAALPRRGARPRRRHHAVRVRQAEQPRDRARPSSGSSSPATRTCRRCWSGWQPRLRRSSSSPATARCSGSCCPGDARCIRTRQVRGSDAVCCHNRSLRKKGNDDVTQPSTGPGGRARARCRRRPQRVRRTHQEGGQQRSLGQRRRGRQGRADLRQLVRRRREGRLRHGDRRRSSRPTPTSRSRPTRSRTPASRPTWTPGSRRATRRTSSGSPTSTWASTRARTCCSTCRARLDANAFEPGLFQAVVANGKPYGAPHQIDTTAILYRKDAFEAAGITNVPTTLEEAWTWEQFTDGGEQAGQGHQERPVGLHLRLAERRRVPLADLAVRGRRLAARPGPEVGGDRLRRGPQGGRVHVQASSPTAGCAKNSSVKSTTYPDSAFISGTVAMAFAGELPGAGHRHRGQEEVRVRRDAAAA